MPKTILSTSIVVLLVFSTPVQGGFKQYLGKARNVPDNITPLYGIRYNAGGFDQDRRKKIEKVHGWIQRKGASVRIADRYREVASQMTDDPNQIAFWIDAAWDEVSGKWTECGGAYADAARRFPIGQLRIVVEPTIFSVMAYNQQYQVAGVYAGGLIRVVNVYVSSMSKPKKAELISFYPILRGEMGNALAVFYGLRFSNPQDEIGSGSPCGK